MIVRRITKALLLLILPTFCLNAQPRANLEAVQQLNQALQNFDTGDWEQAYQALKGLSPLFKQQEDWYHQAKTATWLSEASYYQSTNEEALTHAQEALKVINNHLPTVRDTLVFYPLLLQNLGYFYSLAGDYQRQMQYYRKLYELAVRQPDQTRENVRNGFSCLSVAFAKKMDWDSCIITADAALQIAIENEDKAGKGEAYGILSSAYAEQGKTNKAIDLQREALRLVEDDFERAKIYHNLGTIYLDLGQTQKGIDYLTQALAGKDAYLPSAHPVILPTLYSLVRGYMDLNDFARGETQVDMIIRRLKENADQDWVSFQQAYNYKASIEFKKENYRKAIYYSQQSLAIESGDKLLEASALVMAAKGFLKLGDCDLALQHVQQSLQKVVRNYAPKQAAENPALDQIGYKLYVLDLLRVKAEIQRCKGEKQKQDLFLMQSVDTYRLADSIITSVRNSVWDRESKELLSGQAKLTYEGALATLYQLHLNQGGEKWLHLAFDFSEKNRSILVAENLNEINARNFAQIPAKEINQERNLVKDIEFFSSRIRENKDRLNPEVVKDLEKKLFDKRKSLEDLLQKFENQYPVYYSLKYSLNTGDIDAIQSTFLEENELLLEYFMGREKAYLFIIGKEEKLFVQLKESAPNLLHEVFLFRDSLLARSEHFYDQSLHLYQDLLGDYAHVIDGKNLVVVPDGVLGYLPFEVLLTEAVDKNKYNYREAPYLIRQHRIRYTFSACVALQYQQREGALSNGEILAMAPVFDSQVKLAANYRSVDHELIMDLPELKGSIEELRMLESQFKGAYFLGNEAQEAVFHQRGKQYSLLHLSTHAFFNDHFPGLSYLIFSSGDSTQQDGLLYAYELYGMQLNADLVVLSACNTGFGVIKEGEGIASLARAFAFAGSPNLVMSLWAVEDFSTAKLMELFYANLDQGLTKAEALHQAKIAYLDTVNALYTHPYFWGGFIYTGDREPILLKHRPTISKWWWLAIGLLGLGISIFFIFKSRK
ncbi:MAG: hypothetical protein DHS20C18_09590 [Saprospiraceae bacterium]|nr:MAG: hypothetical protein DHS20C18_09590 [Saprospiraceae bacterium]